MLILIALGAFIATLVGGLFALRLRDKLHLVLGFSAGAIIGVAFFDLLPEAVELGSRFYDSSVLMSFAALGFLGYLVLDRVIFLHTHDEHDHEGHANEKIVRRGILGAGSLSAHSFLDGVAVGLAFQVSASVGAVVTVAVLAHSFSDGINTVNLILKNKGSKRTVLQWLMLDASAPALGVASTLFFTLPERSLGIVLAVFSGVFLYIGASDLIPESHHSHPKFVTTLMTILGAGTLFVAIQLAGM